MKYQNDKKWVIRYESSKKPGVIKTHKNFATDKQQAIVKLFSVNEFITEASIRSVKLEIVSNEELTQTKIMNRKRDNLFSVNMKIYVNKESISEIDVIDWTDKIIYEIKNPSFSSETQAIERGKEQLKSLKELEMFADFKTMLVVGRVNKNKKIISTKFIKVI